ncbi:MAG: hypothetical protein CEE40_12530 [Chloroflexi bacterium B3_Chlor]|nr:MAG: hypothetical protein CEE40_12530 [Chloroflexi bacterium B3_Chlor]
MSRRARIAAIVLPVVILLACLGIISCVKYARVMGHVASLRQHLGNLEARGQGDLFSSLRAEELEGVRGDLVEAGDHLAGIKSELGPVLVLAPHMGWLPLVGGDVSAARDLLEIGIGISSAGDLIFEGVTPLLGLFEGSEETSSEVSIGQAVAAALADGQPRFAAAQAELGAVRQRREGIDAERLSPKVAQLLERLDRYLPLLETGVQGLVVAPYLLGGDEPRTYLLLAQNEHELRATGGFISSVALLRIDDGQIADLDFRDSYAVDDLSQDHPLPPEPLERYMLAEIWLLRDANWYPDFPTTAQVARDLYQLDQGVLVDGVIAADLAAVESLVAVMAPIHLEEYGEQVTAANAMDLMEQYWASPGGEGQSGDWWVHRKDFVGDLLAAMMLKLETDPRSVELSRLMGMLRRGLGEKHVLVYLLDPTVQQMLAENGWDGALRSTGGDFLMVVDTNTGFNKVNPNVESSVAYQVLIEADGSLQSQVSVSYRNQSTATEDQCVQEAVYPPTYQEMMNGCYWNYLRVYVPENGQLLQGPQVTLPEGSLSARDTELGGTALPPEVGPVESAKNVFSTFFVVPPGGRREMLFQYQLPSETLERQGTTTAYRLLVQKQPGTHAVPLQISVTLPSGGEVVSTSPGASSVMGVNVVFETDLLVDREFEILFR